MNWAVLLLPYLGRNDLWMGTAGTTATPNGWCTGSGTLMTGSSGTATFVSELMCPDDTGWGTGSKCAPLSYVVNGKVFLLRTGSPYNGANDMTMAQIKSPQQTIMLGEKNSRVVAYQHDVDGSSATPPTTLPTATPWNVTFTWPSSASSPASNIFCGSSGPWNHPALVIVSFFDGHTATVPDTLRVQRHLDLPAGPVRRRTITADTAVAREQGANTAGPAAFAVAPPSVGICGRVGLTGTLWQGEKVLEGGTPVLTFLRRGLYTLMGSVPCVPLALPVLV